MSVYIFNESDCPICLSEIHEEYKTPCGHKYCSSCLNEWLNNHNNCPLCRQIIKLNTTPSNAAEFYLYYSNVHFLRLFRGLGVLSYSV